MAIARVQVLSQHQAIEVNSVLRSTYLLLSGIIGFSAVCAWIGIAAKVPPLNIFIYLGGIFGLSFLVNMTARSVWGLFWAFAFAGFLGIAMAPMISLFMAVNPMIVVKSLALTCSTFLALSLYTIIRRADFSWLGQFLTVAFFVIVAIIVFSFFVNMTPFSLMISGFMVIVACALILWQTSQIVLGGERNYIIAAVNLFTALYILFINLLSLLSIFGDE